MELYKKCVDLGIVFRIEDDRLKAKVPKHFAKPELINRIKDEKDELLEYIKKKCESQTFITHHSQERLYNLSKGNSAYHLRVCYLVRGVLDIKRIQKTAEILIENNELFRTNFKYNKEGSFIMNIASSKEFHVNYIESNLSDKMIIDELSKEEKPFDINNDVLFRITVYKTLKNYFYLRFTFEHIITDQWGLDVFLEEFIYTYINGTSKPINIQYKDAISKHNVFLQKTFKEDEAFWLSRIKTLNAFQLQHDFLYKKKNLEGKVVSKIISKDLSKSLTSFAKKHKTSVFFLYVFIVNVLLSKISKEKSITTGIIYAERDFCYTQNQIGLFLNNIALNFQVDINKPYNKLFEDLKDEYKLMMEHKHFSFSQLILSLGGKLKFEKHPIYSILIYEINDMVNLHTPFKSFSIEDCQLKEKTKSKYELIFIIKRNPDFIEYSIIYDQELYSVITLENYLQQLEKISLELIK